MNRRKGKKGDNATFLGKFVYGQLRDGAKAKKLIAKSLDTLCRRHFLRNQQTQGKHESLDQVYL
jgi:hypothetical protein